MKKLREKKREKNGEKMNKVQVTHGKKCQVA